MASSSEIDENSGENLNKMFHDGLELYNALEKSDEPTNSSPFQCKVKNAINILENTTRLVSATGVFSTNEGIEEVATNDLQFFLLPALLGSLTLKLTDGDRKNVVNVSEVYFRDFLQRCNDYGLTNYEFKEPQSDGGPPRSELEKLIAAANTREYKIHRFKQQKELKAKLGDLKRNMDNEHVDEEIKRDYFLTMINLFINNAVEEINSIEIEKPILEHMAKVKDGLIPEPKQAPMPPLRPVIITKDELQKAVFGAGYPSLPSMTVQEFYDKRVQEGIFPDPTKAPQGPMSIQQAALAGVPLNDQDGEDEEKERKVEGDDPETLERMRQMDEFKDEHRRGWGNRMNRS